MEVDELNGLKDLGQKNGRTKRPVAAPALKVAIPKEAAGPNLQARPGSGRPWTDSTGSCRPSCDGHARSSASRG